MRIVFVLIGLLALTACASLPDGQRSDPGSDWRAAGPLESLGSAASRWGLQVDRETPSMASLRGGDNRVLVWAAPSGVVIVNGARLPDSGIRSEDGGLMLPRDLVARVADLLGRGSGRTAAHDGGDLSTAAPRLNGRTVMIDAGHGGSDPGAANRWGPPEKDINLDTALRVQKTLAAWGARVLMTRSGDSFPSLDERVDLANRLAPDLFVSLHSNSAANTGARGFTLYASESASSASVRASTHLISALSATGIPSRGLQRENFRVVHKTRVPSLLVEMGFLTNPAEARQLSSASHRQLLADAIARGIANALGAGRSDLLARAP